DLEKLAEAARQRFGNETFWRLYNMDLAPWKRAVANFAAAVRHADRKQQSIFQRWFFAFTRKRRIRDLAHATNAIAEVAKAAHRTIPSMAQFDENQLGSFMTLARDLDTDVEAAGRAKDYLHALAQLKAMRDPAEIATYRIQVHEKIAENSEELWMCW